MGFARFTITATWALAAAGGTATASGRKTRQAPSRRTALSATRSISSTGVVTGHTISNGHPGCNLVRGGLACRVMFPREQPERLDGAGEPVGRLGELVRGRRDLLG